MSLIGAVVNICSFGAVGRPLKMLNACCKSGYAIIDKVIIPIGTFCVSTYIADKTEEHIVGKIDEMKESVNDIKELRKQIKAANMDDICVEDEPEVHNVFEDAEEVNANGEG